MTDISLTKVHTESDLTTEFNYFDTNYYRKPGQSSLLYSLIFYMQTNEATILRSYMKLQDFAAIIGGFMKLIMILGGAYSCLFNNIIRNEMILKELLDQSTKIFKVSSKEHKC